MLKLAVAALLVGAPTVASAQAVIDNGTIRLGVGQYGQLNQRDATGLYGVYDLRNRIDATRAGCECEGWGVAVAGTSIAGYANNSQGTAGLTTSSFSSTSNSAIANVAITGSPLTVSHSFLPSGIADLYRVNVTITNTGSAATAGNVLYRRVMDWDVEPTAFNEYSTIQGAVGAANVLYTSDNGFASANPLASRGSPISPGAIGNFVDTGVADHGALFDFSFDPLAAGGSRSFSIFYGAALNEGSALAALGSVGAEVYSFGQSSDDKLGGTPGRSTFIFGFGGVGGTALPDPTSPGAVPEPASWAMMVFGFGAVGGTLRRRRTTARVALA